MYHLLVLNQHAAYLNKLSSAYSIIFTPWSPKRRRSSWKSCKNYFVTKNFAQATLGMKWRFDFFDRKKLLLLLFSWWRTKLKHLHSNLMCERSNSPEIFYSPLRDCVVRQRYFRHAETVLWTVMFLWGWRCFVWRSSQDAAGSWGALCLFKDIHCAALPFSSVFRPLCSSCVTFCSWSTGVVIDAMSPGGGRWTPHGDRRGRGDCRLLQREGGGSINEAWNGYSWSGRIKQEVGLRSWQKLIYPPTSAPSRSFLHWGALLSYFFPKRSRISCRHYLCISAAPFCDMCVRRTCVASLYGEFCAWEWVG